MEPERPTLWIYEVPMGTYAGIDLHSSNCYLAVIDEQQRRLYSKRLPNSMDHIPDSPMRRAYNRVG
jgi:chromosome condensin MukBEF complex kleisin-like MukF subunit